MYCALDEREEEEEGEREREREKERGGEGERGGGERLLQYRYNTIKSISLAHF